MLIWLKGRCIKALAATTAVLLAGSGLIGCAGGVPPLEPGGGAIDAQQLQPGLSSLYASGFYRHVAQMPDYEKARKEGWQGRPVTVLNHRFGRGEIYDSGRSRGLGVYLRGFLHLPKPGAYTFKAFVNDGIRIWIDRQVVVDDPHWHASGDRFSPEGRFVAEDGRWYPFFIQFYQRKGTSSLELHWKRPGADTFEIVPAEAYGHIPEG